MIVNFFHFNYVLLLTNPLYTSSSLKVHIFCFKTFSLTSICFFFFLKILACFLENFEKSSMLFLFFLGCVFKPIHKEESSWCSALQRTIWIIYVNRHKYHVMFKNTVITVELERKILSKLNCPLEMSISVKEPWITGSNSSCLS